MPGGEGRCERSYALAPVQLRFGKERIRRQDCNRCGRQIETYLDAEGVRKFMSHARYVFDWRSVRDRG